MGVKSRGQNSATIARGRILPQDLVTAGRAEYSATHTREQLALARLLLREVPGTFMKWNHTRVTLPNRLRVSENVTQSTNPLRTL